MLTKIQILDAVKNGRNAECIDGRDYVRLARFFDESEIVVLGMAVNAGGTHLPQDLTLETVIQYLKSDTAFGFEKALNKRGISSAMMYQVVKMWLWVLEDELQSMDDYAMYGLPLFKAVAVKYGFENPIGNDLGSEDKYNEDVY